jgi:hypothetical protein
VCVFHGAGGPGKVLCSFLYPLHVVDEFNPTKVEPIIHNNIPCPFFLGKEHLIEQDHNKAYFNMPDGLHFQQVLDVLDPFASSMHNIIHMNESSA